MEDKNYTFEELCALTGLSTRTLRYYIQIGLVDKPIGQTRAAHYLSLLANTLGKSQIKLMKMLDE